MSIIKSQHVGGWVSQIASLGRQMEEDVGEGKEDDRLDT